MLGCCLGWCLWLLKVCGQPIDPVSSKIGRRFLFIRVECGGFRIRRGEGDREFGGPQPPILGAIDVVLSRLMLPQIWGPGGLL